VLVLGPLAVLALLVAPHRDPAPKVADPVTGSGPSEPPVVQPHARELLDRAASAPAATPYHGVQFVSAWTSRGTTSEVVDVDHVPGHGTTFRIDGTTVTPASSMTLLAAAPSIAGGGAVGLLAAHYSLTVVAQDRVAGRPADVVAARRPGSARAAPDVARFWLDRESGLVLRREVYDGRGRTTRASAFVEVTVGAGAGSLAARTGDRAWASSLDTAALARMRRRGWECPASLPGPLTLVDARRGGSSGDIVHLSYSDGIANVSVFEQRGRLDEEGLEGHTRAVEGGHQVWVRGSVPQRVVWSSGPTVYTVVADAPERTVDQVVAALPHRPAAGGDTLGRLGRGLDRVASWFNPFG
jgi:sigma-E factor negative regulatory protein RseB